MNKEFNDSQDIEELEIFKFHEPTEEEIRIRNEKRKKEILEKGFLPENDGYQETMTSPQELVEQNPRKYIIEECIPACQELWKKNIYTFMVSDHLNEGICWIEVIADSLSDENKEIYYKLTGEDVIKFSYHPGSLNFGTKSVGKIGQERLLELAKQFAIQDVPYHQAYISVKDFLMNYCGCYDEVPNPNYKPMKPPWEMNLPMEELPTYILKYNEWEESIEGQKTIKKYNPSKMNKPLEELIEANKMIEEDGRIYLSQFHYQKHLDYINYFKESNIKK